MKTLSFIFLIIITCLTLGSCNRAHYESSSGIYIRDINNQDTLILFEDGTSKQIVYYKNRCIYKNSSTWEVTTLGLEIRAILFYDEIHLVHSDKNDISVNETGISGLQREYRDGKYCLVWYTWPDIPEKDVYIWYRINSEIQ